jgi:hypothetical protein
VELTKNIFWDTRYESINWDQHVTYVVDRVLHYGTIKDWKQVLSYYGINKVRDVSVKLRRMDKRTLSYCAVFFQIPKEDFRCYNTEPLLKAHWDY